MIGYAFGARDVADTLYPLVQSSDVPQAAAVVHDNVLSPLWGLAFGALFIMMDVLVFRKDLGATPKSPPPEERQE
ncbi:phosphate/sulfate permease [Sphingomonas sp. F9_3S_D5_B_2]